MYPVFSSNKELVNHLVQLGVLKTPSIIEAFLSVDRKDFVGLDNLNLAYADTALPIGYGQTISQPYTVAFMLELLQPKEKDKILDIGAGSGYTTALLASIARKGFVYGKEIIPQLVEFANDNLSKYGFKNVKVELASKDVLGDPEIAPFDKILVSASAEEFPKELLDQLKESGTIVLPIKNSVVRVYKENGKAVFEEYPGFSFVPLQ